MSLNLGDINFGINVNTSRLRTAVNDVVNFGSRVEAAFKRTDDRSKQVAAALMRQEKVSIAALQRVLAFNERLGKAKAPTQLFERAAKSYADLAQQMTSGRLNALAFQRVMERFNADMERHGRSLKRFVDRTKEGVTPAERFASRVKALSSSAVIALGPLSGVGARIAAIAAIASRADVAIASLIAGAVTGTVVFGQMALAATRVAIQLDQVRARFEATSYLGQAETDFEAVRKMANAAGTEFISTANAYTRLQAAAKGTSLEGGPLKQVFEDILFGAAQFRLSTDEVEGTFRAFEQMLSKGVVQSEELRNQLGDRLVGAFNIAAQAMGMTTKELSDMIKAGDVATADFLPKFSAAFRKAVGADQVSQVDSFQASLGRLSNAQTTFLDTLDRTFHISDAARNGVDALASALNFLAEHMAAVAAIAGMVSTGLTIFVAPMLLRNLGKLISLIKGVALAFVGLNAAMMANPIIALDTILLRLGAVAVGAVAGFALFGREAQSATAHTVKLTRSVEEFIEAGVSAGDARRATGLSYIQSLKQELTALNAAIDKADPKVRGPEFIGPDNRSVFQKTWQGLKDTFRKSAGLPDPVYTAWAENKEALDKLTAARAKVLEQLGILEKEEAIYQENARRGAEARHVLELRALDDSNNAIRKLYQETAAMKQGAGAVEALGRAYANADNIAKFRKELDALAEQDGSKLLPEDIERQVAAYSKALALLDSQRYATGVRDALEPLRDMGDALEAMRQGPEAFKQFEKLQPEIKNVRELQQKLLGLGMSIREVNAITREYVQTFNELAQEQAKASIVEAIKDVKKAQEDLISAFREADTEIANIRRRTAAARKGPDALKEVDKQLEIERQVAAFAKDLIEAETAKADAIATVEQISKNVAQLPTNLVLADTTTGYLHSSLKSIAEMTGLDKPILELITALDIAVSKIPLLKSRLTGMGVGGTASLGILPHNAEISLNPSMSPLTTLNGTQSRMTTADAGANMATLLSNQFSRLQALFGRVLTINDAIAKSGTSRESNTPGSQHFHGNALDLSIAGMDDATRIRLVQAALAAGFTGFGLGSNILHLDVGAARSWAYGNSSYGGMPIADVRAMIASATAGVTANSNAASTIPVSTNPETNAKVEAYRKALEEQAAAEAALDTMKDSKKAAEALVTAQQQIDRINETTEAYKQNAGAVERLQKGFSRIDEIEDFRNALIDAGVAQDVVNAKVREFQNALAANDAIQEMQKAAIEFSEVVDSQLTGAVDGVASAFANAIVAGEGLSSLADLGRQVAGEILAAFLKLYILKPLLSDIFPGSFGGAGGGGGGGGGLLSSFFTNLFGGAIASRKGNAMTGSGVQRVRMMRKGGILSRPTLFSTTSGPVMGGEASSEAIMPLVRSSSGDLAVKATGNSGGNVFNFNFPPGTDVAKFRKSEHQMAAVVARVAGRGAGGQ